MDDLKAQLNDKNDMSVELIFRRSSLDEARALMAQALKAQGSGAMPALSGKSFTRMRPSSIQVRCRMKGERTENLRRLAPWGGPSTQRRLKITAQQLQLHPARAPLRVISSECWTHQTGFGCEQWQAGPMWVQPLGIQHIS